ncbi:MAG: tRNA (guanosine(46)-N7)-methyltransferase TrmB [Brumimicrobium sp.]|nr:tRNA (guanosine(46)-N7)-methyltransferase TrmB [Brumimicrobium sp.]
MGKNKLFKFAEIKKMSHVFEPTMEDIRDGMTEWKGKWCERIFQNEHPITLELGCGKGEYTVGMARKYPNRNFIGVDIKGNRIFVGAKQALDEGLENVFFIRTKIDMITHFFDKDEVDEIWLTFSDPQPNKPNKRLTSRSFIERYLQFLKPNGIIHLKTDSDLLFESTQKEIGEYKYNVLFSSDDIYRDITQLSPDEQEILSFKTHYEKLFVSRGSVIKYCKFRVG